MTPLHRSDGEPFLTGKRVYAGDPEREGAVVTDFGARYVVVQWDVGSATRVRRDRLTVLEGDK